MSKLLLNPGPTNTRFMTKVRQWLGSDVCHREQDFKNVLTSLQNSLLSCVNFTGDGRVAVMAGSGTAAMEAMVASLVPSGTVVINAGSYGLRATQIFETFGIEHEIVESSTIEDLVKCENARYVYFVENETSTGEHYALSEMCKIYPNAKFFIDATSAFGASEYREHGHQIAALSLCSNKCLQSTPGLGIVLWDANLEVYGRTFYGDVSRYHVGSLPFTLPTQAVYSLEYTINSSLNNKALFNKRRDRLIKEMDAIGIQCLNKHPSNSVIAFKHPTMQYQELHDFLLKRGIVIYSGVPGVDKSFRISTMSAKFDKQFNKIIKVFYDTCVH